MARSDEPLTKMRKELRESLEAVGERIRAGNVVAFVGAGFAAPVIPGWVQLLRDLNVDLNGEAAGSNDIHELLERDQTSRTLEAVAQLLEGQNRERFRQALKGRLETAQAEKQDAERLRMRARVDNLRAIPFKSILTSNFDGLLTPGDEPGPGVYRRLLREGEPWWSEDTWGAGRGSPPIIHLHGDLNSPGGEIVFTRRDYLKRVHSSVDYRPFLRTLLMTHVVLFIGFSFTDAYINELRAETMTVLGGSGGRGVEPLAYALLDDVPRDMRDFLREYDGIEPIAITSENGFQEFDDVLKGLRQLTDPVHRLRGLVGGRRILWMDPNEAGNERGMQLLAGAAEVRQVGTVDEAEALGQEEGTFDLVITRWGHKDAADPDAIRMLEAARSNSHLAAPVIVFASGQHAAENKERALRHGATAYEYQWSGLFREIERIMSPPS